MNEETLELMSQKLKKIIKNYYEQLQNNRLDNLVKNR